MEWLSTFAAALLAMMNPLGNVGMFASLTEGRTPRDSKTVAWKSAAAILVILLISTWAGHTALKLAGINVEELRTGGGIITMLIGLRMLFNDHSHAQTSNEAQAAQSRDSIAIVPLAIPIVAGPGTMALVIAIAGEHPKAPDKLLISVVCLVMSVFTGFVFSMGHRISAWLGVSGMAVVTRVMGMVLTSIAMGMLARGIKGLFPELFG